MIETPHSPAESSTRSQPGRVGVFFRRALHVLASALFLVYLAWNVLWLARGRFAPSLMTLLGLPGPTTGWTRALRMAARGEWAESFRFHPLALPIAALILITVEWLLAEMARRRPARLPGAFLWVWGALLGASWLLKLFSPHERW